MFGVGAALDDQPPFVDLLDGLGGVKERGWGDRELVGVAGYWSDRLGERGSLGRCLAAARHGDALAWAVLGGEDHGGGQRPVLAVIEAGLGALGSEQVVAFLDRLEVGLLEEADRGLV